LAAFLTITVTAELQLMVETELRSSNWSIFLSDFMLRVFNFKIVLPFESSWFGSEPRLLLTVDEWRLRVSLGEIVLLVEEKAISCAKYGVFIGEF
jgi:hypothetical protein